MERQRFDAFLMERVRQAGGEFGEGERLEKITPELTASYQISQLFNYLGPLAFRVLSRYDYPWEVFCRVMRGDRSSGEIKKRCRPDILFRKLLVKSARNRPIA